MKLQPLRLRLTLAYVGSILGLLISGVLGSRWYIHEVMHEEFERSIDAAARLVQGFFRVEISEHRMIEPTLAHIGSELFIPGFQFEFVRPDNSVYHPPLPASLVLKPLALPVQERNYPLDLQLAPGWAIRISASVAFITTKNERIDQLAWRMIPLAILLALSGGWLLTGRAFRPAARMAAKAIQITPESGGRLPIDNPHDELGQLGTHFNKLLDRLNDALGRQQRFLADAAHELRTPVARARGISDLALSTGSGNEDRQALIQVREELTNMSHLVNELMELARSDVSTKPAVEEQVFLDDLVTEAIHSFSPIAAQRRIRLDVVVPDEIPIAGDPLQLERLISILVDNALRYSPDGSTIRVAAERVRESAELSVTDQGIGIEDQEREHLFERFFRGGHARQLAPDGSGLGLAIAANIARQHRATLAFDPQYTGGSRVVLRLPLLPNLSAPPVSRSAAAPGTTSASAASE